jgi:putative iron-dependent peroxidase
LFLCGLPLTPPEDLDGFNEDLVGVDDYAMPATQHDAVLWLSGSAYDVVFEVARNATPELRAQISKTERTLRFYAILRK